MGEIIDIWFVSTFLAVLNNAAINIHVHILFGTYVFISLRYIPRIKIAGSYGNSMFNGNIMLSGAKTTYYMISLI